MSIKLLVITPTNKSVSNHMAEAEMWIGLKKQGIEIDLITHGNSYFANKFKKEGIHVIDHYPSKKVSLESIKLIKDVLKKGKYDILHLTKGHGLSNGVLAAKGIPVKVITYIGSKSLYWHDPTTWISQLSPRVDKIHCVSHNIEQHVKKQILFRKKKTFTIHKGYNPDWFSAIKPIDLTEYNIPKDAFVICCLARHTKVKGIPYLVEAMKFLPKNKNIHLLILGTYTNGKDMADIIAKHPYKNNIHALGRLKNALDFLAASHIYVQPSLSEGLGRAILEAMSLEKPTIITNAGGCTELIENEKSGIIVPVKNAKAISEAILRLYKDKELRTKLGKNAKNRVITDFHTNTTVEKMYHFYKQLAEK